MSFLELDAVKVSYGMVQALHGVSLQIEEGKVTSIIGSNGAGKTTIINAISAMVPYDGEIRFDGKSLLRKSNQVVKKGLVQVPEGRKVFAGLSVEENLLVGAYSLSDRKEIPFLLDKQYSLFPRLEERKRQDAGTLSGGEQQMLVICRALMAKPQLLMLDEPSLGLAPIVVHEVFETIQRIRDEGTTILLVEQNANKSLCISDYGYVIENGKIILEGKGMDLLSNTKVAEAYLGGKRRNGNC
jgi:branched-chain amino acid transport system ATP-binding protein